MDWFLVYLEISNHSESLSLSIYKYIYTHSVLSQGTGSPLPESAKQSCIQQEYPHKNENKNE